jgi:dienelactone hydrolase
MTTLEKMIGHINSEALDVEHSRRRILLGLTALLTLPSIARGQGVNSAEGIGSTQAKTPALAVDPASYRTYDKDWQDESRKRAVPVRIYLPAASLTPLEGRPLVIFSHGIGGSRNGYSYLGTYLASQGTVSLHVQHVGSDRNLWFGNPFSLVDRLQGAAQDNEAVQRVRDVRFALDQFLSEDVSQMVDKQRIVAAGHSYGANTTMLLAGARVARDGAVLNLRDARVRAAVIISAPPFYGELDPGNILGDVTVPSLHITATEDVISIPGYVSPAIDRIKVFDAMGGPSKALAVFSGGSHSVFTDRAGTGGPALNPKIKQATRELMVDFITKVFEGDASGFEAWPLRYRNLLARWSLTTGHAVGRHQM